MFWKATSYKLYLVYTVGELIGSQLSKNVKMIWLAKRLVFMEKHQRNITKTHFRRQGSHFRLWSLVIFSPVPLFMHSMIFLSNYLNIVCLLCSECTGKPARAGSVRGIPSSPHHRGIRALYTVKSKSIKIKSVRKDVDDDIAYVRT
jgi:hypothetical protein